MILKIKHIGILIILLLLVKTAFTQKQQFESFSANDFLGEKDFLSASQDQDLNIYFKSNKDILKFNGTNFTKVKLPITLKSIDKLYAYKTKLFISDNTKTYSFDLKNDSLEVIWDRPVIQFQEYEDQLWMLSKTKLTRLNDQSHTIEEIHSNQNEEVFYSFNVDNFNTIIGHSNGLTVLKKDKNPLQIGTFLSNPSKIISVDSNTYILNNDAIFNYYNGEISRLVKNDLIIKDFFIDDFGKTWSVDSKGKLWVNNGIETEEINNLFPNENIKVFNLFNDKENNLWVLGKNQLLKIVQNNPFSRLNHSEVTDIFNGNKGNLLVRSEELIHYNVYNKKNTLKIPRKELPINTINAFELDNTWIISFDKNIYEWNIEDNNLSLLVENSSFIPFSFHSNDSLLAYNQRGEIFFLNNNFLPIRRIDHLNSSKKLEVLEEKIVTVNNQNTISTLNRTTQNTSSLQIPDSINASNLVVGKDGFWYFNEKDIYFINKAGNIQSLQIQQYELLENKIIIKLFDDHDGNLWISTKSHLLRVPITIKRDKISSRSPIAYNKNDFLYSTYFKDAKKDLSGVLWFINHNGISLFNPLKEIPNLIEPGISIEKAFAYSLDEYKNPTDTINLLADNARIKKDAIVVIEARVINHLKNEKSQISYRNISINQAERKIEAGEKIILTDFEDGRNTLAIKAINSDGVESRNEEMINMTVIPPIWKRNWFYLSGALSLLLLGFIGYKTVINIKNNRAKELEDELHKGLEDLEKKSHLQVLKAERLKQLNELITSQKGELEKKNTQIESQKYELSLTNQQIKKQKDLLEETSSKLKSSINYAKRIQNALMSTEVEIKKAFQESFVYFLPRDVVSGDFFWFKKAYNEKNEELHILAAVDCTGHGVPGAIVSVVGMNLLNNITKLKKIYDPGQILTELNYDIISDLRQDETQVNDGMDMTIVTFNTVTKQLYFAGAKNPLMYVEDGELIRIKGDKHAIGGQQRGVERDFETHHLDLTDGKKRSFYLFSDGYQDQFGGEKGFKYLTGNFKKLLVKIHDKEVLEQKTILHEEIEDWKDGYAQTDDILVIGFRI
ncbi:SpoIIE family protein phosphatase [Marivirga salinae]|uniref:SpoIIE family protein phosphatase n=1 Tax=Marivirga salinarum TaxID=3059078 RepID=A0AA51RDY3_9BACT|nr:SpoIIE family protein phosphatase [Marivirga sp. BDSF4-3]WMN11339.1 SpoIIE family protein phosphatase [Marivirga sp. BDSF4-3]